MNELNEQQCDTKYTFWKLLSEYQVEIPIIQRDYAQGRNSAKTIRDELLNSIYDALVNGKSIDFDFVYGSTQECKSKEDTAPNINKKLYPLDGQQRLTTFYLLHWYLAQKEKRMEEARVVLKNFTYTTRISSRDFCEMLVDIDYTPSEDVPVSEYIMNENKYFLTWKHDPTISSMLTMLDAIHNKFFKCEPLFDKLIVSNPELMTFNYLPMNHFALTDDLYIKMNARGKALTNFENFKAKFIQRMKQTGLSYERFVSNVDSNWVELLWDYRASDNTVDRQYMNLFCFFTDMIFLMTETSYEGESPFKTSDIRPIVDYYDSEEKVNLLYDLMDLWKTRQEANKYLEGLLSKERNIKKVRVFDCNPDIFSDVVAGNYVTVTNKILLFSIMYRLVKNKNYEHDSMLDYVRIVRNFLIQCRSFKNSICGYTSDFRFGRNGIPVVSFITHFLAESDNPYSVIENDYSKEYGVNFEIYKQESRKAKLIADNIELKSIIQSLEDLDIFRGSIFNILDYVVDDSNEVLVKNLENLFLEENSTKIVQALLSFGDYVIHVGSTILGEKYFFANRNNWYDILTYSGAEQEECSAVITAFIKRYQEYDASTVDDALDGIISENLKNIDINDWRYCLIKYPSTLEDIEEVNYPKIVFIFEDKSENYVLHRMNGKTLNGRHVIPEFIEVRRQLADKCNSPSIVGKNSDDLGMLLLNCKSSGQVWIAFDECCTSVKHYQMSDDEINIIDDALEKYNNTSNLGEMDTVERLVLLSNLLIDTFDMK